MSYDECEEICRETCEGIFKYLCFDRSKKMIKEDIVYVLKVKLATLIALPRRNHFEKYKNSHRKSACLYAFTTNKEKNMTLSIKKIKFKRPRRISRSTIENRYKIDCLKSWVVKAFIVMQKNCLNRLQKQLRIQVKNYLRTLNPKQKQLKNWMNQIIMRKLLANG